MSKKLNLINEISNWKWYYVSYMLPMFMSWVTVSEFLLSLNLYYYYRLPKVNRNICINFVYVCFFVYIFKTVKKQLLQWLAIAILRNQQCYSLEKIVTGTARLEYQLLLKSNWKKKHLWLILFTKCENFSVLNFVILFAFSLCLMLTRAVVSKLEFLVVNFFWLL